MIEVHLVYIFNLLIAVAFKYVEEQEWKSGQDSCFTQSGNLKCCIKSYVHNEEKDISKIVGTYKCNV